jgi:hypothetical protein
MTASVTLKDGTVLTDQMSAEARHNAVARSLGLPTTTPRDARAGILPPIDVHPAVTGGLAHAGESAAPSTPVIDEAAIRANRAERDRPPANVGPHDPARVEAFDREMREKGLQTGGRAGTTPGAYDTAGHEALTERYKAIAAGLIKDNSPSAQATLARFKAAYENDLKSLAEGRVLTEKELNGLRSNGKLDSFLPEPKAPPAAAPAAATPQTPEQWTEAHKEHIDSEGWIPFEKIDPKALSGYTLPNLIDGQHYNAGIFVTLRDARAAGVTQAQVDAFVRAQMKNDGWIK